METAPAGAPPPKLPPLLSAAAAASSPSVNQEPGQGVGESAGRGDMIQLRP